MEDKPAEFDITKVELDTVPTRLYEYSLDLSMSPSAIVHIPDTEIGRPGSYIGKISMQVVPEFRLTMKAIQEEHGINQKDCYATLAVFGLSEFQHIYSPDLKRIKRTRTDAFFSGNNMANLVEQFGTCEHFFDKQKNGRGGRKEVKLYGDKNRVVAVISDNAEFFNLSLSDMAHVVLSHAIVKWEKLPADFKKYFEDVNREFSEHARSFYNNTSRVGQGKGQSNNRTIGQSDNE